MDLIMQYFSLHQTLFLNSEIGAFKDVFIFFNAEGVSSIAALNSNFSKIPTDSHTILNEQFFIILALVLGVVLMFFWIKFINRWQSRKQKSDESSIEFQTEKSILLETKLEMSSKIIILEETEQRILDSLKKFEEANHFNQKEISLYNLAHEINTNTKYLSNIIKKHKKKSFNSYINDLRINYIVQKLKNNPTYLNYKISHLADEVGFSSHSAFSSVFYQLMGVKPSVFIKKLKEETNQGNI